MTSGNPEWTLDGEICKLVKVRDVADALHTLGLLTSRSAAFSLHSVTTNWYRGGAETYIYRFQIREDGREPSDVLLKACVAFAPATSIDRIVSEWVKRRKLLESSGVPTPKLYWADHGVVVEEYIAHSLRELLQSPSQAYILDGLVTYAAALSKHGFAPIGPFDDLRSRGNDVVPVDFGQDLGPPSATTAPRPKIFEMLRAFLRSSGVEASEMLFDELQAAFAARGGERVH